MADGGSLENTLLPAWEPMARKCSHPEHSPHTCWTTQYTCGKAGIIFLRKPVDQNTLSVAAGTRNKERTPYPITRFIFHPKAYVHHSHPCFCSTKNLGWCLSGWLLIIIYLQAPSLPIPYVLSDLCPHLLYIQLFCYQAGRERMTPNHALLM